MIDELNLWAAQDALLTALEAQPSLADVATGIGFPKNIQPDHVWIAGVASGSVVTELSGDQAPSDETFRLKVLVYAQRADDYTVVRDQIKYLVRAVVGALSSDAFAAVVPAWTISAYELDEGTDGQKRQLALELTVECRCW